MRIGYRCRCLRGPGKNYGKVVDIDHQNGYTTRYDHLPRITIQKNTQINRSDVIGLVGKTGQTTGCHLHYEIRRNNRVIDPVLYSCPE
ncbi:MAG TPA: M23 family metallopeptidase, partial [candidate division Zixibacteria bacterium]|nr:M23 family metallopeptidase [candidate division Zixibacteria bacterium]